MSSNCTVGKPTKTPKVCPASNLAGTATCHSPSSGTCELENLPCCHMLRNCDIEHNKARQCRSWVSSVANWGLLPQRPSSSVTQCPFSFNGTLPYLLKTCDDIYLVIRSTQGRIVGISSSPATQARTKWQTRRHGGYSSAALWRRCSLSSHEVH